MLTSALGTLVSKTLVKKFKEEILS